MKLSGVPGDYRHYAKVAVPVAPIEANGALLKFYHLERPGEPVPEALAAIARHWLEAHAGQMLEAGDRGFAILHRCGADFHFLLTTVWRDANEAWEAVAYHRGDMVDFARFDPAYPVPDGANVAARPTFCVWELAIVAQEARSWSAFLLSDRGADALAAWRADMLVGPV